jgi:hypothetical protein
MEFHSVSKFRILFPRKTARREKVMREGLPCIKKTRTQRTMVCDPVVLMDGDADAVSVRVCGGTSGARTHPVFCTVTPTWLCVCEEVTLSELEPLCEGVLEGVCTASAGEGGVEVHSASAPKRVNHASRAHQAL